ncbi:glycosyltransferase family 61 protein [Spirosoma validum]|uniref:Glycosyltransferase family 61 protein n=1 Tax=Spirosoma validum TaxID=2771355 RepID=A0A927B122_9BACT|nr:glycosyltransferase family 61 protein [Spirosoma validum]MBD2753302.1 glycosyltransferase family 61 protein [Spirosoma validum]
MKHILFISCLKFLRKISSFLQIGNPHGKAPFLVEKPDEEYEIYKHLDHISIWKLHNVICNNLFGGLIIDANNKTYKRFTAFPWGIDLHPGITFPYLGRDSYEIDKAVFLITPEAEGNYYHWIVDLLPRLVLLSRNLENISNVKIILHKSTKSYEKETLEILDLPIENIIRLNSFSIATVKEMYIADYINYNEKFPIWKKQLIDSFIERLTYKEEYETYDKIYLVRGNQKTRRLIGEKKLIQKLRDLNFKIIDPQTLSLSRQIYILSKANTVIGVHGAALTNIIFCKEKTKIIELRSNNHPPEFFSEIAKTYNLNFCTVSIDPVKTKKNKNSANRQNLLLTEENTNELMYML